MSCWWGVISYAISFFLTNIPWRKQSGDISALEFWWVLPCSMFRCVTPRERKWLIKWTWHLQLWFSICGVSHEGVRNSCLKLLVVLCWHKGTYKTVIRRFMELETGAELVRVTWAGARAESDPASRHVYANNTQTIQLSLQFLTLVTLERILRINRISDIQI